jgi:hypothetical protein
MQLPGTNCVGQLHYDSPLHPVSPVFLIRQVGPRSERVPHFSDGLCTGRYKPVGSESRSHGREAKCAADCADADRAKQNAAEFGTVCNLIARDEGK